MKLIDILPIEKWVELEKEIYKRSGLDSSIFDMDGIRISEYKEWVNRLCPVIKDNDKGQSFICAVAHMNIAALAMQTKTFVIEECDAGLLKLVVPILVKDEFVGAVGACGLLLDDGEVDFFMVNKTIGIDEDDVVRLSDDIGRITTEDAERLGKFITAQIDEIVSDFEKITNRQTVL